MFKYRTEKRHIPGFFTNICQHIDTHYIPPYINQSQAHTTGQVYSIHNWMITACMQLQSVAVSQQITISMSLSWGQKQSLIFKHQRLAEDLIRIISLTTSQTDYVATNDSIWIPIFNLNVHDIHIRPAQFCQCITWHVNRIICIIYIFQIYVLG